ncbi:MAG: potassium channel family protein, partial [Novipirellula sp. JB048]
MKSFTTLYLHFVRDRASRRNLRVLAQFVLLLVCLILLYSVIFHYLMAWEGRRYSWITGLYWTLTVMSTLGFGDITFHTDLGRVFSMVVLMSGTLFMLILL